MALIELLDDQDNFVVSKAVEGLSGADMVGGRRSAGESGRNRIPIWRRTSFRLLASGDKMRKKALPHLQANSANTTNPAIRAAALTGMVSAAQDDMQEEITAGFSDADSRVRIAAAKALFKLLERYRGSNGMPSGITVEYSESPADFHSSPPANSSSDGLFGGVAKLLGDIAKKAVPPRRPRVDEKKKKRSTEEITCRRRTKQEEEEERPRRQPDRKTNSEDEQAEDQEAGG